MTKLAVLVLALACFPLGTGSTQAGIKFRITDKGLTYAMDVAMDRLQKDIKSKPFKIPDKNHGKFQYQIRRSTIDEFQINNYHLKTLKNSGIRAVVSQIKVAVTMEGRFKYRLLFKISDRVKVRAKADGAYFEMDLGIGKRTDGRPFIALNRCNADIGGLKVHVSGSGASWLYNIAVKLFKHNIQRSLNKLMCRSVLRNLNKKANSKLAVFEVQKQLDEFGMIDYSLAKTPEFKQNFMDIYLKGSFIPVGNKFSSSLTAPTFPLEKGVAKMVYLWLTDYTLNTAGEVYHKTGGLKKVITHKKALGPLKPFLRSNSMRILIPGLYKKYPNHLMDLTLRSSKPPQIAMKPNNISILASIGLDFRVITKEKAIPVYGFEVNAVVNGKLSVSKNHLRGNITNYRIEPFVSFSNVGRIGIPLGSLKEILELLIVKYIRPKFKKGLPLPASGDVSLHSTDVKIMQRYILISSDLTYIGKTN